MILRITSKFGSVDAVHKIPHKGIDIAVPEGTKLHSIADGVVDRIYDGTGTIGKGLSVKFPDGSRVIYGHLSEVKAHIGELVQKDEIVGLSGNTGHSTGPHLHLGLKDSSGHWLDPTPLADKVLTVDGPLVKLGGWLHDKLAEITFNVFVDHFSNFIIALPVIAVVSFGVYALINMVSKNGARLGAIATLIYGWFLTGS
jgi:Membrane proteins related to metalloendopeptidases